MRRLSPLQDGCVAMMWLLLIIVPLTGCKTVQYVPVETIKTDTAYVYKHQLDSVIVRDSVFIEKGDTVKEYRYKYIYRYSDRVDTVYVSKTDSIQVPYPIEKKLSKWEQTKVYYGGYALAACLVVILIIFGKLVYKLRK